MQMQPGDTYQTDPIKREFLKRIDALTEKEAESLAELVLMIEDKDWRIQDSICDVIQRRLQAGVSFSDVRFDTLVFYLPYAIEKGVMAMMMAGLKKKGVAYDGRFRE